MTNRPAFPSHNNADLDYNWIEKGMTLRDYYIAAAIPALIERGKHNEMNQYRCESIAEIACRIADAIIDSGRR